MPAPLGIERGYQKFQLAIRGAAVDLHWGVNSTLATLTLVHTCQALMPLGANPGHVSKGNILVSGTTPEPGGRIIVPVATRQRLAPGKVGGGHSRAAYMLLAAVLLACNVEVPALLGRGLTQGKPRSGRRD